MATTMTIPMIVPNARPSPTRSLDVATTSFQSPLSSIDRIPGCPRSGSRESASRPVRPHPHQHLAEVLALEQAHEGLRRALETFEHGLAPLHLPFLDPLGHVAVEVGDAIVVVADDEALHADPLADYQKHVRRSGLRIGVVVAGDHAAGG